jgi:hypothetical protein
MGARPIVALGSTVWWPGAHPDFAGSPAMAILQHELQHVLEYAERKLGVLSYLLWPPNWSYHLVLAPGLRWERLGAEQRAMAAELLWHCEHSGGDHAQALLLRELIPWAHEAS